MAAGPAISHTRGDGVGLMAFVEELGERLGVAGVGVDGADDGLAGGEMVRDGLRRFARSSVPVSG